jgi:Fur family iron response transcriptional regulator
MADNMTGICVESEPSATVCLSDYIAAQLRSAGLRPTSQRIELGCILFSQGHRHISAEDLHAEAVATGVKVSLATVYNTLHQFAGAALLRTVAVDGTRTYFDTNVTDHHHFLVEGEGKLIDIGGDIRIGELPPPPDGTEITAVQLVVRVRRKR